MPRFALARVGRLPDKLFAKWRLSNDTIAHVEVTKRQYTQLKTGIAPPNTTGDPGAVWLGAKAKTQFDTASRTLAPGEIAPMETGPDYFNSESDRWVVGMPTRRGQREDWVLDDSDLTGNRTTMADVSTARTRRGASITAGQLDTP